MISSRAGILCAAALVAAAPASAQLASTPRALGMGGAYVAVARGQEALFYNPANLALPGNPHATLAAPQITVAGTLNGLEFGDLGDLASYDELEDSQRADILGRIPDGGTSIEGDLRIPIFSMSVRRAMFGISYNAVGSHGVARDVVDLVLNGVSEQRLLGVNAYDDDAILTQSQGRRAAYVDLAAGYAHRVGPVSLGATAHYLIGRGLVRAGIVDIDTVFAAPNSDVRVTYAGLKRDGGSGFGLDLGAALQPIPSLTLSAAVTNVVNTLEWTEEPRIHSVTLDRNDYVDSDPDLIRDEYSASARSLSRADSALVSRAGLLTELDEGAELVPTLRLGAAWQPRAGTTVAASYQGELSESRINGLWDRTLGVGVQQKIPVVTLRAGIASDLDSGSMLSGGLSLGPLHLGAARLSGGSDRNGWLVTFGLGGQTRTTMN